ncbi:MAG: phosphotransferase [Lachnospiraceae bacterium]|nr:phosphotransferase [Lachnospiraceae bacterium]
MFLDIEESKNWESIEPVDKGWSSDRKYRIRTSSGEKLLLRVSDIAQYEEKKKEYRVIEKYSKLGFPMSTPVSIGICNDGKNVYMLLSWVDGCDLEEMLPKRSEEEQYRLGRKAGEILKKIHSVPLESEDIPQKTKQEKKLMQLGRYENSNLRIADDETAIQYVKDNIGQIWQQPPVYMHGDFHPGNLIYMADGSIGVIDFNRWEVGDPYEEFYKLESFGTEISIPYCIGQIDAYFSDNVPEDFWKANAVYVAQASLFSIKWAEPFGQKDIDGMVRRAKKAFADFDGFRRIVPKWYSDRKK